MVGGITLAGQPDGASLHPDPASAARLKAQQAGQINLARGTGKHLVAAGLMPFFHVNSIVAGAIDIGRSVGVMRNVPSRWINHRPVRVHHPMQTPATIDADSI